MTDLCTEDMMVHIGTPQIITTETTVPVSPTASRGGFVGGAAGVECGRRLLLAARAGDTATVCALLSKGAPFATDWLGTSPLHMAAAHAHADTVTALLRAGLSRDARTKVERTPLHVAASAGHAAVVAALLAHGADVDCRDMLRMTPLHWAIQRGHKAVALLLLRAGADPTVTSKFRQSPLSLAAASHDPELLRLIEDALKEREAARSVNALTEQMVEEEVVSPEYETIHIENVQTTKPIKVKPVRVQHEKNPTKVDLKTETVESGQEPAGAKLLRAHGITLLPADDSGTVLSALQSGRTIVLSDAGKLMLKESSTPAAAPAVPPAPRNVRLTATPVTAAAPGVKVFTLSGATKLRPLSKEKNAPVRRIINPHDLQQVKFVQLPENAKIVSPQKAPAPATPAAPRARPAVKLVMNRASLGKLLAAGRTQPTVPIQPENTAQSPTEEWQELDPEQQTPEQLRVSLQQAQAALAECRASLQAVRSRLALYEPNTTL